MRRRDGDKKRRVERQEQAVERRARYDALTNEQRIARIVGRPGWSEREAARLGATINFDGESIGGVRLA